MSSQLTVRRHKSINRAVRLHRSVFLLVWITVLNRKLWSHVVSSSTFCVFGYVNTEVLLQEPILFCIPMAVAFGRFAEAIMLYFCCVTNLRYTAEAFHVALALVNNWSANVNLKHCRTPLINCAYFKEHCLLALMDNRRCFCFHLTEPNVDYLLSWVRRCKNSLTCMECGCANVGLG